MAYTSENYQKLKEAIANGVQSVTYGDKTVAYRSISEMKDVLKMMEAELFPERTPRRRRFCLVDRGYFKD